ncbi:TraX family protein [Cytobacillus gottheilii]|nr:TraX family protein [Cytobacillus gottheilii]
MTQWIMIAALPFMLRYNEKKGIGLKCFFYFFYPIHIIVLYLIGIRILNQ